MNNTLKKQSLVHRIVAACLPKRFFSNPQDFPDQKADPNLKNEEAPAPSDTETQLDLVAHGEDLNSKDCVLASPLDPRAASQSSELRDRHGRTSLALAAGDGETTVCLALLKNGADLESKDNSGLSPLAIAAIYGNTETCLALIDSGASLESKDNGGNSPLARAAYAQQTKTCLALIARGADVSSVAPFFEYIYPSFPKSVYGSFEFPLHFAAALGMTQECTQMVKLGYDLEQKNKDGLTPLQLADNEEKDETASAIRSCLSRLAANRLLLEMGLD